VHHEEVARALLLEDFSAVTRAEGWPHDGELVGALSGWLFVHPQVKQVVARAVLADNIASRRALENAGFLLEREEDGLTWYTLHRA
jgi:RimJ/RimL family protein N-acetyltransferase